MPRPFSARERDLLRRRLLEASRDAFAAFGSRASVDDVVRAAGISQGAFYLFYESKEALLLDLLEQPERREPEVTCAASATMAAPNAPYRPTAPEAR